MRSELRPPPRSSVRSTTATLFFHPNLCLSAMSVKFMPYVDIASISFVPIEAASGGIWAMAFHVAGTSTITSGESTRPRSRDPRTRKISSKFISSVYYTKRVQIRLRSCISRERCRPPFTSGTLVTICIHKTQRSQGRQVSCA